MVQELLPKDTIILPVNIIKKDLTNSKEIKEIDEFDIYEIVFRFDYVSNKIAKKVGYKAYKFNDKLMIKGVDYWKHCISVRSIFKYCSDK